MCDHDTSYACSGSVNNRIRRRSDRLRIGRARSQAERSPAPRCRSPRPESIRERLAFEQLYFDLQTSLPDLHSSSSPSASCAKPTSGTQQHHRNNEQPLKGPTAARPPSDSRVASSTQANQFHPAHLRDLGERPRTERHFRQQRATDLETQRAPLSGSPTSVAATVVPVGRIQGAAPCRSRSPAADLLIDQQRLSRRQVRISHGTVHSFCC